MNNNRENKEIEYTPLLFTEPFHSSLHSSLPSSSFLSGGHFSFSLNVRWKYSSSSSKWNEETEEKTYPRICDGEEITVFEDTVSAISISYYILQFKEGKVFGEWVVKRKIDEGGFGKVSIDLQYPWKVQYSSGVSHG